jgi:hypothetical protein
VSKVVSSFMIVLSLQVVFLVQNRLECVHSFSPEALEVPDPLLPGVHGRRIEATQMAASPDRAADEAGAFQNTDVLGRGGERHPIGRRQVAYGRLPLNEPLEHGPAGRVGQGMKDRIEIDCSLFNHVV